MTTATVRLLTPEIVLMAAAVAIYLGGAFSAARRLWGWIAGGRAWLLAAAALWAQAAASAAGRRTVEPRRRWPGYGRWLALAFGALLVLLSLPAAALPAARRSTSARCC